MIFQGSLQDARGKDSDGAGREPCPTDGLCAHAGAATAFKWETRSSRAPCMRPLETVSARLGEMPLCGSSSPALALLQQSLIQSVSAGHPASHYTAGSSLNCSGVPLAWHQKVLTGGRRFTAFLFQQAGRQICSFLKQLRDSETFCPFQVLLLSVRCEDTIFSLSHLTFLREGKSWGPHRALRVPCTWSLHKAQGRS